MKKTLTLLLALTAGVLHAQDNTFTNPLLPSGADPFSFYKDGFYYYTNTTGSNITIWKTRSLADLATAEHKVIYRPPAGTPFSKHLWAPEIHFLQGKWYAYFAADSGKNEGHRMYVLENASPDPMKGEWTMKGRVADPADKWAIDGNLFEYKNVLYMIWSGWAGDVDARQNIYIAKMKNPWTVEGHRVMLSTPEYEWEKSGQKVVVNEGPQALMHKGKLMIVYSASGCWTDHYALGLLRFSGKGSPLDSTAWTKHPEPLFKTNAANKVFAPGHNSFFKSPDGREDWILYHANAAPGLGCGGKRSPRMQRFTWGKDGMPVFGEPVAEGVVLKRPGEGKK
jgi:GH43 family beta-xylosidase